MTTAMTTAIPDVTVDNGDRWRSLPAHAVVSIGLNELLTASQGVEAVVAHLPRANDAQSLLTNHEQLFDPAHGSVLECCVNSAHDRAFVFLARRVPNDHGHFHDSLELSAVDPADSPVSSPLTRLWATPQRRSVYGGLAHDEFLIETGDAPGSISDLAPAARVAAGLAGEMDRPLWFVNGPAAPPTYGLRRPSGPFLRFGVTRLSTDVGQRIEFGHQLVERCARMGLGVWLPEEFGRPNGHDYWHQVAAPHGDRSSVALHGTDRAITLIGPARPGMTARIVGWIDKTPGHRVVGLYMTSFADVAIVDVLTTTPPTPSKDDQLRRIMPSEPAQTVLTDLYGEGPSEGSDLWDHSVIVTDFARCGPCPSPTGRGTLWLSWHVPHAAPIPKLIQALQASIACATGVEQPELHIDYLINRAVSASAVVGRAKISLRDDALDTSHDMLSRITDRIEGEWRTRAMVRLEIPWIGLRVAWRESWIRLTSSLHGGVGR